MTIKNQEVSEIAMFQNQNKLLLMTVLLRMNMSKQKGLDYGIVANPVHE